MSAKIHSTAIISKEAKLADDVEVGPYAVIGPQVRIGAGTRLGSHVVIEGRSQIGENCSIFTGACLGGPPQDRKFNGESDGLFVGNGNVIREYVTIHGGSKKGSATRVGDNNFIMVNSHIGHDCVVGSDITLANGSVLGGHAVIEDKAVLGGYAGIHQFVRIGKLCMIGAFSKLVMDAPPFTICDGLRAKVCGLNSVGLRRAGYSAADLSLLKKAFKTLFTSGLNLSNAVQQIEEERPTNKDIQHLLKFIKESKRGVTRALKEETADVEF